MVTRMWLAMSAPLWFYAAAAFGALPPLPSALSSAEWRVDEPDMPLPQGDATGTERTPLQPALPLAPQDENRASSPADYPARSVLEGPPIPLPPPARMSDAAARNPGEGDDDRRISLNLNEIGRAHV